MTSARGPPLRRAQESLRKLPSICDAASYGLFLLSDMAGDFDVSGAFKGRVVSAGLAPPLVKVRVPKGPLGQMTLKPRSS